MKDPGIQGIRTLLVENRDYRRLWLGQVVSQAGDWINHIAVMTLLLELTGLGTVIAYSLILRMLPSILVSPIAGVLIDRWDRRRILIATDVLRGLMVPLFLLANTEDRVWLVYVLVVCQVSLSAFFEPAKSAVIPNLVQGEQLLSANALSSVTWSMMVAIGSAMGGLLIEAFGLRAAFVIDALTFFVSAWLIVTVRIETEERPPLRSIGQVFKDLVDGFRYILGDPSIFSLVLVKTGVGLAGGMVLLFSVLGERVFRLGATAAAGISVLFFARGLGTAIGPFVGRAISGYHEPAMRKLIGVGFLQAALFFVLFGFTGSLLAAAPILICAHIGTSINWVFSTVLLQLKVPDEYRGRVFSAELFLFTIIFCIVTRATGYALDELGMDPQLLASLCGGSLAIPGLLWIALQRRAVRRRA